MLCHVTLVSALGAMLALASAGFAQDAPAEKTSAATRTPGATLPSPRR
jgi:hypothetical protein